MVHSPYRKTVYPPIQDLGEYRRELCQQRSRWEEGERDKYAEEALLGLGEALVDHCNFLDTKLDIKKGEYTQLVKQNEALKRENEALRKETEAQKREAAALKVELERAAATAMTATAQLVPNDDETGIEANSENAHSGNATPEAKPEKSGGSPETVEMASPHKRGAEIDPTTDGNAAKKGRKWEEAEMR